MRKDDERTKQLESILDNLYENWRVVRMETIAELGELESLKIIDFHANNWIDITRWIASKYKRSEQVNIPPASWGALQEGMGRGHPTLRFIPTASCGVFSLEFYKHCKLPIFKMFQRTLLTTVSFSHRKLPHWLQEFALYSGNDDASLLC